MVKIYPRLSSKAMADWEKNTGGQKDKNLSIAITKRAS